MCQQRQVYLKMMAGKYKPRMLPCSLYNFGDSLASGRHFVRKQFSRVWAQFDSVACEMILENALSNAFKHGCPQNPSVSFVISEAEAAPGNESRVQVLFRVTNRANPDRPKLTEDYIQRLVNEVPTESSKHMPVLSDQVGLSHCYSIAKTCGFAVSLKQENDLVTFEARVTAERMETPTSAPSHSLPHPLPRGLCIHLLDDSRVARRLVTHQLTTLAFPGSIKAFGATADEVLQFVPSSLGHADIAIMDEHLEYGAGRYAGSDLLRHFVSRGFQGLLCTRWANVSEADIRKYMESGAHCVLGKDMSASEMVDSIAYAYHQLQASRKSVAQVGHDTAGLAPPHSFHIVGAPCSEIPLAESRLSVQSAGP